MLPDVCFVPELWGLLGSLTLRLEAANAGFAGRVDHRGPMLLWHPVTVDHFDPEDLTANLAGVDSPTSPGSAGSKHLLCFLAKLSFTRFCNYRHEFSFPALWSVSVFGGVDEGWTAQRKGITFRQSYKLRCVKTRRGFGLATIPRLGRSAGDKGELDPDNSRSGGGVDLRSCGQFGAG
jgi:hypothetical protein